MADPHGEAHRYDATRDEFKPRGRSSPAWRLHSPSQRWSSSCPVRYRQSPPPSGGRYPARSQSPPRSINRSTSPAPRGERSPRRRRSRSPPSSYTVETLERRRRRLLAEKVMSMQTYHRLVLNPRSPWSTKSNGTSMPIPVPLEPNENMGDYQQKFEFWLAQMNVTLLSLRDDIIREREYRCNFAQWRVNMRFGQEISSATNAASAYGPQLSGFRSSALRSRYEDDQSSPSRMRSPTRSSARQAYRGRQTYTNSSSASGPKRCYNHRRNSCYEEEKSGDMSCNKCGRNWSDLNRRLKQLEAIVSRLDHPPTSMLNGTSSSPYEVYGEAESPQEDASRTSNWIDLTEDMDNDAESAHILAETNDSDAGSRPTEVPMTETLSRSVEITPTDSELNYEGPSDADLHDPSAGSTHDLELKSPPQLTLLIDTYNSINEQVLLKQKEEANVIARLDLMTAEDEASAMEPQSELDKLQDSLKKEKEERDGAVAAVLVHDVAADKRDELERDLEQIAALGDFSEQEDLHEKCAGIAAKVGEKENELARLKKQLQSLGSLSRSRDKGDNALRKKEADELSGKIRLEQASKISLETERHKIFTRLMKSSRQIQALEVNELTSKM